MDTTCLANGQRQTATLNYEISTMCETKPRTSPQKAVSGTGTGDEAYNPASYMMIIIKQC
jgi:hypothetical protein